MRTLQLAASCSLLVGALGAQCVVTTGGTTATLLPTTTFYPADDEGRSAPIDMLFGPTGFPMTGAAGPLTHVVIGSNGELYLTSGGAPVDAYDYGGIDSFALRGAPGASPRIWPCSTDLEGLAPTYDVRIDTSIAGQCKVTWIDVEEYFSGGPQFSFSATLSAAGTIEFSYGTLPSTIFGIAGVSIGNGVGTGSETSVDLTAGANSGTLGLIFQDLDGFTPSSLSGFTVLLAPNGTGGYQSIVTCQPAGHTEFGTGCHSYTGPDASSFVELFAGSPAAKAALDGNAVIWAPTVDGYVANWLPGVAATFYLPPSGAATTLALTDDSTATFTPSIAAPIPGGTVSTWTVSSNGILTAAPTSDHGVDLSASLAEIGTATQLAWYCWRDYNPNATGSGTVKWEEVGSVLAVTFDGVYEYNTTNPATFQWQVDLASGTVTMVFVSLAASTNTTNLIAGCTLAGDSTAPVSTPLTTSPFVMVPQVQLFPMTLSAAPAPVINPSTVVTFTASDLPEFVPGSGVYLATCFLSVNPNPAGFDLAGILTTVPGCNAYILSLDLDLGAQVSLTPSASWNLTFSNAFFAPGNVVAAQAVALFDGSIPLPNGESGGFLLSNGVRSYVDTQ